MSRSTAAEELSKSEERLRESLSECKKLKEEKARMEVVVRLLEAEVKEVQDHFREVDYREFRQAKRELSTLSKTCRNFQFKLRRSQIRERELCQENSILKAELKRTRSEESNRRECLGRDKGCGHPIWIVQCSVYQ